MARFNRSSRNLAIAYEDSIISGDVEQLKRVIKFYDGEVDFAINDAVKYDRPEFVKVLLKYSKKKAIEHALHNCAVMDKASCLSEMLTKMVKIGFTDFLFKVSCAHCSIMCLEILCPMASSDTLRSTQLWFSTINIGDAKLIVSREIEKREAVEFAAELSLSVPPAAKKSTRL